MYITLLTVGGSFDLVRIGATPHTNTKSKKTNGFAVSLAIQPVPF
jgi:hypothetical protein